MSYRQTLCHVTYYAGQHRCRKVLTKEGSQMGSSAGTVFLVDDSYDVRTSLPRLLRAVGYQVRVFDSAERYLEGQDDEIPGCLLLDIGMPGMSGLELQRALYASPSSRPIVF